MVKGSKMPVAAILETYIHESIYWQSIGKLKVKIALGNVINCNVFKSYVKKFYHFDFTNF